MESLIDRLLSVENEAGAIIEKARVEAKEVEKQAKSDIAAVQKEVAATVEEKFAGFREQALSKHEKDVADQEAEARKTLEAISHVPADLISKQAEKIAARFREI